MNKLRLPSRKAVFKKYGKSLKIDRVDKKEGTKMKGKEEIIEFKIKTFHI
jgi:hypothetical protein